MLNRYRQTGAFLLVTLVFLMAAGGAMLYAMANLSSVSSTTVMVTHNSNQALLAAQSGLKYCVIAPVSCPNALAVRNFNGIPCTIEITDYGGNLLPTPVTYTITSRAYCPDVNDPYRGAKELSIQVQHTSGGYQIIPASRKVLPLP